MARLPPRQDMGYVCPTMGAPEREVRAVGGQRSLTVACQGLALLALEGLSTGLCLASVALGRALVPYVARNELSSSGRAGLVVVMLGTAAAFVAAGLGALWRTGGDAWAMRRTAFVLSPLVLVGLLPPLAARWLWAGRELTLLVIVGLIALGGQALLRVALSQRHPRGARQVVRMAPPGLVHGFAHSTRRWSLLPVVIGAVGYATFFAYHTMANHWNVRSRSFDLGIENNLLWNLVHGGPLFKSSPIFGPTGSHLGHHATFFAYAIAPVYVLAPRPETLLVIQAVLMGAASIALFFFARRHLGGPTACVIALAYLLYPPLHGANLYDFHYLSLAPFFLWTSLGLLEARRDRLAAAAVLTTLLVREDVAAGLVILGLYLLLSGERPRAGLIVALIAGAYFAVMKFIIMPLAGPPASFLFMYKDLVPEGDTGFAGVLKTVLGNPAYTISTLLERQKLVYLLHILVPLAFLPLGRPLGVLFLVPGFLFTLLSTGYAPLIHISFQYTSHWTAFVFPALVLSLAWLSRPELPVALATARRHAWLAAVVTATLLCTYHYGAVLRSGMVRGGFEPFMFGTTAADRQRYRALSELVALIPPTAKVVASERIVPHVSSRPDAYTLRVGVFDAEYLLFPVDTADLLGQVEAGPLVALLESGQFGVVTTRPPYALAARGHATRDNASVLARLARP